MNRPTLQQCEDRIAAFAASELPLEWSSSIKPVKTGESNLTLLDVFWEGREEHAVPREARLYFGLDDKLLIIMGADPGLFCNAVEEGFDFEEADRLAMRRLASFEELFRYLKGEAYHLADRA